MKVDRSNRAGNLGLLRAATVATGPVALTPAQASDPHTPCEVRRLPDRMVALEELAA
jgi:hypothetical protein